MLVVSRSALLTVTASMAAGLLAGPSAAYAADTSTPLSAAEMSTALKAVTAASAQAAAQGWKAAVNLVSGPKSVTEWFVVDPAAGVALERYAINDEKMTEYLAAGKGMYTSLDDPRSRAAVTMMHRSSVRYVFSADKSLKRSDVLDSGLSPSSLLRDAVDQAGTKTVHDDGTIDYQLSKDGTTLTVHVTAAGVMDSADAVSDGLQLAFAYTYGRQHVTLPAASTTISAAELIRGMAYLDMAMWVKQVAGQAATDTLEAAHHHNISVSTLRKVAQHDATATNAVISVKMIKTVKVSDGVRLLATNPWTHRTVSYTLTSTGRKITIAQN